MINAQSTHEEVRTALYRFYGLQNNMQSKRMQTTLEEADCKFDFVTDHFRGTESYKVTLSVSPESYANKARLSAAVKESLIDLIQDGDSDNVEVAIKLQLPQEQRTVGINNCFFKQESTILHDELRFRSKSEVVIYDELKQRDVLFFPNPVAILGASASKYYPGPKEDHCGLV